MYSVSSYGKMVADSTRREAYFQALRRAINPTSVVLELGSGTGVFALVACKLGARRVYAIEPNDAIIVAQANAAANGFSDRIVFIQDVSTRVTIPDKVDVLVSDLRGILPLFELHLPSIADARNRFLLPGGVQIPQSDRIFVVPVEAPDAYQELVMGHDSKALGVDVEAAVRLACNTQFKANFSPEQLLAEPQLWATIDYTAADSTNYAATVNCRAARKGFCHGLAVWFDAVLSEGISYSNAPGQPCGVYRQVYLPWPTPVELVPEDLVTISLKADLVGQNYLWRWDSRVIGAKRPDLLKAAFQQSDFLGIPRVPAHYRKRSPQYVPLLAEDGQIDRFVMDAMNGSSSVQDIAAQVLERFPTHFKDTQDAIDRVAAMSSRYSR